MRHTKRMTGNSAESEGPGEIKRKIQLEPIRRWTEIAGKQKEKSAECSISKELFYDYLKVNA